MRPFRYFGSLVIPSRASDSPIASICRIIGQSNGALRFTRAMAIKIVVCTNRVSVVTDTGAYDRC